MKRSRALVALVLGGLVLGGSVMAGMAVKALSELPGTALEKGSVLELPGGVLAVAGDGFEVVVSSSSAQVFPAVTVEGEGFRRDSRARPGTLGLKLQPARPGQASDSVLRVRTPQRGSLTLTLVGKGRLVLDGADLAELRVGGVSSPLQVRVPGDGGAVEHMEFSHITGGLVMEGLGNLGVENILIDSITGDYTLDFAGPAVGRCAVVVRAAVGNGVLRIPETRSAEVALGTVIGNVVPGGFTATGSGTWTTERGTAEGGGGLRIDMYSVVGQIQLVEVQQ
jgi:hypothetical protein